MSEIQGSLFALPKPTCGVCGGSEGLRPAPSPLGFVCVVCRTKPSRPSQPHSKTSTAAAESISLGAAGTARRRVYDYILSRGSEGATDEEIADVLRMNPNTARPRRVDLTNRHAIVLTDRVRKTKGGGEAGVYVAMSVYVAGLGRASE